MLFYTTYYNCGKLYFTRGPVGSFSILWGLTLCLLSSLDLVLSCLEGIKDVNHNYFTNKFHVSHHFGDCSREGPSNTRKRLGDIKRDLKKPTWNCVWSSHSSFCFYAHQVKVTFILRSRLTITQIWNIRNRSLSKSVWKIQAFDRLNYGLQRSKWFENKKILEYR